ncbi:hypothetical protein EV127DRAFT_458076 [Xylaria flabelliformis]|nr:hypothetical protein EV127DRAFT_458076 [Xylaria flabelliformis]
MYYLFYGLTFTVLVLGTALYLTRNAWLHLLPDLPASPATSRRGSRAALSTSGANVDSGDARAGLDNVAKTEILKIMKKRRLRFDEARRVYMEQRFSANGIGADGRPRDPKFVSFS